MKYVQKGITLVLILVCFVRCEEFLEIDPPKDQMNQEIVFNDVKAAEAAVGNLYVQLFNSGFFSGNVMGNGYLMSCYTDELEVTTAQNLDFKFFYDGAVTGSNDAVKALWNATYQQIYTCNNLLEGISSSTGLNEEIKKQFRGEVLTIRGLLHFYLVQNFGSIPYVTSTDFNLNRTIVKESVSVNLNRVVTDLREAESLLSRTYPSSEKIRINQLVTKAIMARVFLYQKNWSLAQQYADDVIESELYEMDALNKLFLKESKSAIWQLKPTLPGLNTYEAFAHIFFTIPAPQARLNLDLLNSFEKGDLRLKQWVKFVGTDSLNAHAYKYKQYGTSATPAEYPVVIRIEEMYLISCEAAAEMEKWSVFNERINILRGRAGLSPLNIRSRSAAIDAILQERRVEFFCEYGHRFYDLKRKGELHQMILVKPNWKSYFELLPLPENELILNTNLLPQNDGY